MTTTKEKVFNFIEKMRKNRRKTFTRNELVSFTNANPETCMRWLREFRNSNNVNYQWEKEKNLYRLAS